VVVEIDTQCRAVSFCKFYDFRISISRFQMCIYELMLISDCTKIITFPKRKIEDYWLSDIHIRKHDGAFQINYLEKTVLPPLKNDFWIVLSEIFPEHIL